MIKLFGDEAKNINAIVSLAAAFFVVAATPIVDAINALIPSAAYLIVTCLLILMVMGFFVSDVGEGMFTNSKLKYVIFLFVILIFLGIIDYTSSVQIPIIHSIVGAFLGTTSVGGGGGVSFNFTEEDFATSIGVFIMLAVVLFTIWFTVKK